MNKGFSSAVRGVIAAVVATLLVCTGSATAHASSLGSSLPLPQFDGPAGAKQQGNQTMVPEGTNDPNCKSDDIVVLVHGTDSTFYADYSLIGSTLARDGWCVFGIDYGYGNNSYAWAPMRQSAKQIDELVDNAMATYGATRVHMVGFSQGATVSRYWVNKLSKGRAASWLGLASPTYGAALPVPNPESSGL